MEKGPAAARVAANIKALREHRGWGLADMSRLLASEKVARPMAPGTIYKIEQGDRRCDVDDLVAFAAAFDVPITDLIFEDDRTWRELVEEPQEWRPALGEAAQAWITARDAGVPADHLTTWLVRVVEAMYRVRTERGL